LKLNPRGKKLTIIVIIAFGAIFTSFFLIDWLDKNVISPRVWKDWTCDEMKKFAVEFKDEQFNEFQRSKFHEDLSRCLAS